MLCDHNHIDFVNSKKRNFRKKTWDRPATFPLTFGPVAANNEPTSSGARKGLTGNPVQVRDGPAAVTGDENRNNATGPPAGKAR